MFGRKRKNRDNSTNNKNGIMPVDERKPVLENNTENNILRIRTDGGIVEIEVLDIIENETLNRNYIVYRFRNQDDVLISILNETEDSFSLDSIEDEEEFKSIEEYLASKIQENWLDIEVLTVLFRFK